MTTLAEVTIFVVLGGAAGLVLSTFRTEKKKPPENHEYMHEVLNGHIRMHNKALGDVVEAFKIEVARRDAEINSLRSELENLKKEGGK